MGNQIGSSGTRMATAAMSNVTHVEKREIAALLSKFRESGSKDGNPNMIRRTQFTEGLGIVGINQNDADIFDRLFTMYDKTGDDQIVFKEFIVGICPLISGTHLEKIDFAFQLYDIEESTFLKATDMINILSQMNRVASYFGDPVMTEDQISSVILDIVDLAGLSADGLSAAINYAEYVKVIAEHPIVQTFISGGGSGQFSVCLYNMTNK
jgi:Ca2+-binding EF-hand superfamily protein